MNEVHVRGRHLSFFRFRNDAVVHPSGALDYDRVHEVMNWHSGETIAVIPSFDPPGRYYWDGHGLMIAQSTYLRAVTRGRDPRSRQQRPFLQMMPIPLPWDPATYVESIGSSPRFGLNQMQRLPTMTGIELRLPDSDERWRLSLRAGPQLDIPSFSLQGLPSDSNDLMMFHYSAQLAAQHESSEGVRQADVFLFVDVLELLREVTYSLQPVLRSAALTEVPWPD
ncbi:hypothetical protein PENSPDRAFT_167088 [Peniophora sp. CONT]|nr:hypothetical protein PENSPDRAFT_167088 [Peniophora sp. CONT]